MTTRTLVTVTAGLTLPSSTRLLADRLTAATVEAARGRDLRLDTQVVELRDLAHDVTNHLLTGFAPARLAGVLDAVAAADALIVVTPVFNASYSGLFKSFVDVLGRDVLAGKPVLVAATGGSVRHSLAVEHTVRPLFTYLRAAVVPTAVFAAAPDWGDGGADLAARVQRAAGELVAEIARRPPAAATDPFDAPTPFAELLAGR